MSSSTTFICNHQICKSRVFSKLANLHQHLVSKHLMKKCCQCQKNDKFFDSISLKKHNLEIHGKIVMQQCQYCGKNIGKKRKRRHSKFCKKGSGPQLEKKWARENFDKCYDFYFKRLAEQYHSNDGKKEQLDSVTVNNFQIPKRKMAITSIPPKFRYPGLKRSSLQNFF